MNGRVIVAVHIYDVVGTFIHSFIGHHNAVTDLCWSDDSGEILTASVDQTAKVFSMSTNNIGGFREVKHVASFQHTSAVRAAKLYLGKSSANPALIITGADDCFIRVWDRSKGTLLARLQSHTAGVSSIALGEGGKFYSADSSGAIRSWLDRGLNDAKFNPDSEIHWATRFVVINTIQVSDLPIRHIEYQGHPERVAVFCCSNDVFLVSLVRNQVRKQFTGATCERAPAKLCFSPDKTWLIAGSNDGKAYIWDVLTRTLVKVLETGYQSPLYDVAWHPTEHLVALCSHGSDAPILLLDHQANKDLGSPRRVRNSNEGSEDSHRLVRFESTSSRFI